MTAIQSLSIERKLDVHGNLYPSVLNVLKAIPDELLHHAEYGLRHPLATFNLSSRRVVPAFEGVLDALDQFDRTAPKTTEEDKAACRTLEAQHELLDAMMAYMEDGYHILKALYPGPPPRKPSPFVDRWLTDVKFPRLGDYVDGIAPYRDSLAAIVNRIKHQHGRIRHIMLTSVLGRHLGYYLEGVQESGAIGPDQSVHPAGDTAFSFNRHLKLHLFWYYSVGHVLRATVVKAAKALHDVDLSSAPRSEEASEKIEAVCRRVAQRPYCFFPDEVFKPIFAVQVSDAGPSPAVFLQSGARVILPIPQKSEMRGRMDGDGVSRTFALIYYKARDYRPFAHQGL